MPQVLNRHRHSIPIGAIYIGRGSKWGNQYHIGIDGTRDEVCDKYERDAMANPQFLEMARKELKGKDLVCYCAPLRCHGDFLLRIANE